MGARVYNPGLEPEMVYESVSDLFLKSNKVRECRGLSGSCVPCPYLLG